MKTGHTLHFCKKKQRTHSKPQKIEKRGCSMSEGVVLLSYFFTEVENEIFRDFEVINQEKSFIKKKQVT